MSKKNASTALLEDLEILHKNQASRLDVFEYVFEFTSKYSLGGGFTLRNKLLAAIARVIAQPLWSEDSAIRIMHEAHPTLFQEQLSPTLF